MLLKKVQKNIKERNMIEPNDTVIVGLSGGADSVCLFLILCQLRETLHFSLEVVHVEHGIRGEESRQDAAFVEALSKEWNVYYQTVAIDVPKFATENGLGLEEAARIRRYEIFEQLAKERKAKIALAHHMEDNAETILFQLARGSSLTGLCGMQAVRKSEMGTVFIRPLLCLHRSEIESYLEEINQSYCVDSTNKENAYSRNYLRNVILPAFTKVNCQTIAHINETAEQLGEIRGFLDEQVQYQWEQVAVVGEDIRLDVRLDVLKIKNLHVVLQKEICYKAISILAGGRKDISSVHVEQVMGLFQKQSGKEVTLPNGVLAIKENETIRLFSAETYSGKVERESRSIYVTSEMLDQLISENEILEIPLEDEKIQISVFERAIFTNEIPEIPRKTYTKWMDYDKIKDGFCIRTRRSGDYLIYDVSGHRKKLKQYFVDEKVPVTKRDKTWILAQENLVLWVAGGRMSEHLKVTDQTKFIAEITIKEEA